jgi:hypothetical protein
MNDTTGFYLISLLGSIQKYPISFGFALMCQSWATTHFYWVCLAVWSVAKFKL